MNVLQLKQQKGFTLIELMIVIAIIAILAAIAIPAYNQYIIEANMTRVNTAYEGAISASKSEMARRQAMTARGTPPAALDAGEWVDMVNPDDTRAPGGDLQFTAGAAVDETGVIGVAVAGTSMTITRPAYEDLSGEVATIDPNGQVDRVPAGGGGS